MRPEDVAPLLVLGHGGQIEIRQRDVVGVETESPAHRVELSGGDRLRESRFVGDLYAFNSTAGREFRYFR
jgi:hypothetical protein